jgi:hypothetical protein
MEPAELLPYLESCTSADFFGRCRMAGVSLVYVQSSRQEAHRQEE